MQVCHSSDEQVQIIHFQSQVAGMSWQQTDKTTGEDGKREQAKGKAIQNWLQHYDHQNTVDNLALGEWTSIYTGNLMRKWKTGEQVDEGSQEVEKAQS